MITNNTVSSQQHQLCHNIDTATTVTETPNASAPAAPTAGVAAAASSTSTLINENDVLCGRGKGVHSHIGNKHYRLLIHANINLYTKCHANDKKKITRGIIAAVRNAGGRFISYDRLRNTVSADIGDKKAKEKTSQAMRDKINKNEDADGNEDDAPYRFDTSCVDWNQELPQAWYTDYSSHLMKSITINNSPNTVTAGDAPQNEMMSLGQNHQEVHAYTYTSTTTKSSPFDQEHVTRARTRARDAHHYQPLPERESSESSHFSFGSFLDGCFEEAPQNERVALVQNHQEGPAYAYTRIAAKSSSFHQEHVTRARDAHHYQPLLERESSESSHFSFGSFLDGCLEENATFDPVDVDGICNALISAGNQFITDDEESIFSSY